VKWRIGQWEDMETHFACMPPERAIRSTVQQGAIVVVEDPFIQRYLGNVLTRRGYQVIGTDADRATRMLRSGTEQVDLIITNSPGNFLTFADTIPLLYMAGAPDMDLAARFLCCRVLKKPFHPDHLLAAIRELAVSV
jgi:hypothetical protein